MSSGYGPDPVGVRRPSLALRLAVAVLLATFLVALSVGLPEYLLAHLGSHSSVGASAPLGTALAGGTVSVLTSVAYVLRPTRAYGPAAAVRAAAAITYFLTLSGYATFLLPLGAASTVTVNFAPLLELLALIPVLGLGSAIFAGLSDWRSPLARLRRDFPG